MFFVDLLFAFVAALILSLLFIPLTAPQREREGGSLAAGVLFLFLLLFFATWAGGVWLTPMGPPLWGSYWLSFVVVGLFVALLLAAVLEPSRRYYVRSRSQPTEEEEVAMAAVSAFSALFWVVLIGLLAALIARYVI